MFECVTAQYVVEEVPLSTVSKKNVSVCQRPSKIFLYISGIPGLPKTISALPAESCLSVVRVQLQNFGVSMFVVSKVSIYHLFPSSTCMEADWTKIVAYNM